MSLKDTKGKEKLRYIPYEALKQVALVREFGTKKYGDPFGYVGVDADDFVDAALRHLYKHLYQQPLDDESGLPHLAHAACSILLAIDNLRNAGTLLSNEELDKLMDPTTLAKAYREANKEMNMDSAPYFTNAGSVSMSLAEQEFGSDS